MRIVSANITGSVIVNGVDVTDALTSTSENSGSISQKLDSLQSSTSSLNSFTSSINTTIKNYINSETVISGSVQVLITGTTGYSDFSSSISTSIGSLSSSVATTTSDLSSSIGSLSGSIATTTSELSSSIGSLSGSVATTTSGLAGRILSVENKTGSYATTGSNVFTGDQVITGSYNQLGEMCVTGNITSTGQIIAQTINVQQVTSSIVYSCGSNTFGCSVTNNQVFTGSVFITGATLNVNGGTICSTSNTCFGGMSIIGCCLGIGTISPSGSLHSFVASSGDNNSYIEGNGSFLHIKGRADYSKLYIDGPSTARWSIGTEAGQDLLFKQADSSTKLTLFTTGVACFASSVCANYFYGATSIVAEGTLWSGGSVRKLNNNQCLFFRNAAGDVEATIGGSGNFGINITTPTAKLYVQDSNTANCFCSIAIFGNSGNSDRIHIKDEDGTNQNPTGIWSATGYGTGIYSYSNGDCSGVKIFTGIPLVERMRITSTGLVGINNISPNMPLSVSGCASIDRLAINCTGLNVVGEHLQVRGCARFYGGNLRISDGPNDGNYMFLQHDDTNGYLCICRTIYAGNLILSPFGGIGINTSVVSSKLTVNSGINTSSANVLTLQQATNGANKDAVAFGLSIQNGGESTNAADLYIGVANGGTLIERLRITNDGAIYSNYGSSGTSARTDITPNLVLEGKSGVSGGRAGISILASGSCGSLIMFGAPASSNTDGFISYNNSTRSMDFGTADNFRMRITSSGAVGIGTSSPSDFGAGYANLSLGCNARIGYFNVTNGTINIEINADGAGNVRTRSNHNLVLGTNETARVIIANTGIACFACQVCAPIVKQPTGFVAYTFPVNYGASFADLSSGSYLSIGGTEPGTVNNYCAYAHGGISPRAVASDTESMSWTCLRFILRVLSPSGGVAGTPTYLQTAGYFYSTGFYGIGGCTDISIAMDGTRGYSTVVLPWIPYSSFTNSGDVTGFGIRNVGPSTTRIGSVFIQYK